MHWCQLFWLLLFCRNIMLLSDCLNLIFREVWCTIQRGLQWSFASLQFTADGGGQTSSNGNHLLPATVWSSRTLRMWRNSLPTLLWMIDFVSSCLNISGFMQTILHSSFAQESCLLLTAQNHWWNSEIMFLYFLTPLPHALIYLFPNYRFLLCSMGVFQRLAHQFKWFS